MNITVDLLKETIKDCKTDKQVLKALDNAKIPYNNDTEEYGYFNLHFDNDCRIYKDRYKNYKVQGFTRVTMSWSGIPTFNPSGVNNLDKIL